MTAVTSNSLAALYPVLGVVTDYETLLDALRARRNQLRISGETIEHVAGLQERYATKILSRNPKRALTPGTFGPLLSTLCLRLVVLADDTQFERIEHRLPVRQEHQVRHLKAVNR